MSHTNGDAHLAELHRHIRVLEQALPDNDAWNQIIQAIHTELGRFGLDHRERHDKTLGVLTDVLTKLNELVEAQNRNTSNFTLLLAGMRLASAPQSHPPPKLAKAKRGRLREIAASPR